MSTLEKRWLGPLCLAAAVLALATAGLVIGYGRGSSPPAVNITHQHDRRDFALSDVDGRAVTLATFQGKWVLLFFGYTSCPDVCPTSLLNMTSALTALGDRAKTIQPVFITVDPERDSEPVLKDYLANFGGNIVGLTGTPAQIADVAHRYGTFFQKQATADGSYLMNHSSGFELLSPSGQYVRVSRSDVGGDELAPDLIAAMAAWKD